MTRTPGTEWVAYVEADPIRALAEFVTSWHPLEHASTSAAPGEPDEPIEIYGELPGALAAVYRLAPSRPALHRFRDPLLGRPERPGGPLGERLVFARAHQGVWDWSIPWPPRPGAGAIRRCGSPSTPRLQARRPSSRKNHTAVSSSSTPFSRRRRPCRTKRGRRSCRAKASTAYGARAARIGSRRGLGRWGLRFTGPATDSVARRGGPGSALAGGRPGAVVDRPPHGAIPIAVGWASSESAWRERPIGCGCHVPGRGASAGGRVPTAATAHRILLVVALFG